LSKNLRRPRKTRALVERFSRSEPPAPARASEALPLECLGEISGVALTLLSAARVAPLAGVLGAFKAGLDLAECSSDRQVALRQAESDARAVQECVDNDGLPGAIVNTPDGGRELYCAVESKP
jgi:hypothetical protein